jgi:dTDP-4-amino-4,6-dideoxygalactose transaminase
VRDTSRFIDTPQGTWHQEVHEFGLNYRLTDFQCALGIAQLEKIAEFKNKRQNTVSQYREILGNIDGVRLLKELEGRDPMWHLLPVFIENRNHVLSELRNQGIMAQVNYVPAYFHPVFANLGYKRGVCPNSERFYANELSLPLHTSLTKELVSDICTQLKNLL